MNPLPYSSAVIAAPFGSVLIQADANALTDISLRFECDGLSSPTTALLQEAARQLDAYFQDPHHIFSLPFAPAGTAYQQRVWQFLCSIPAGTAQSYGHIAKTLDSGPRAVAGACRANPFPLIVPCHRVVASNGLGGYGGAVDGPLLDMKRWLLRHEGYDCT
jgi:methylated-DNA-[protein]-cysteine S-methyltransferase